MAFSEQLKLEVKKKSHFRCCLCEKKLPLEIHHIIPQAEGGPDEIDNAAPLCNNCHDAWGDNPIKRKWIRETRDHWYAVCAKRYAADEDIRGEIETLVRVTVQEALEAQRGSEQGEITSLLPGTPVKTENFVGSEDKKVRQPASKKEQDDIRSPHREPSKHLPPLFNNISPKLRFAIIIALVTMIIAEFGYLGIIHPRMEIQATHTAAAHNTVNALTSVALALSTPSPTSTFTSIPDTPTLTDTPRPSPTDTMQPSLTSTSQPSPTPTIKLFAGQDFLSDCISTDFWKPYGDPEISPNKQNGCWSLTNLGLMAQNGNLFLRNSIVGPTNLAHTVGIFTEFPDDADTVIFHIKVNEIRTVLNLDAILMLGIVPAKTNATVVHWENGKFLYYLVGIEGGNPLIMRGEPDTPYWYIQLDTARFEEEYRVKLTLRGGKFSIFINDVKKDSISWPYFEQAFWIGYQLRDSGSVNTEISGLCFESSSGDFSTCLSE